MAPTARHRSWLHEMGFEWTMYDGSAAPDAETIFAPMPVNENGIMECAQADVARLIEFLESLGADCPTASLALACIPISATVWSQWTLPPTGKKAKMRACPAIVVGSSPTPIT